MPYTRNWNIPLECITKEELLDRINNKSDYIIVDTIGNYHGNKHKIKTSTTIDYPTVIDRRKELAGHSEIIIYCKHKDCVASKKVASALISLNVKNVKVYEGGIDEWVEHNLPIEEV
ncbi:MAG: rhodanese-like domain-containing protein [Thermodesulfovibrionia bacterium]|nr:rhodanese-like domain-containing protein [Thermodesulfovibrionia bacterium]